MHDPTSQAKISVSLSTINTVTGVLKIFTLAGVKKIIGFSDLLQRLRENEQPNHIEKAVVLKITAFVWTGP